MDEAAAERHRERAPDARAELETLDAVPHAVAQAEAEAEAADEDEDEEYEHVHGDELHETHDAPPQPLSLPPMPSKAPPAGAFSDEREAATYLVESGARQAWAARAEWLRAEAQAIDDATKRARALLTVSELYAMAGDDETSRVVAHEARELAPTSPLAHRQLRGSLARDGDWQGALAALDAETRVAPTAAARCHGLWLGSEIARLRLGDREAARKRAEHAVRAAPADPRGHLQRFAEGLADPSGDAEIVKIKLPPEPAELAPLASAFADVLAHRGLGKGDRQAATSYEALLQARASLGAGDVASAVAQLARVGRGDVVEHGAAWLAGVLAAPHKETRARAVASLRTAAEGSHGPAARRAIASRAIELGDAAASRAATESADGAAFTAADRVALAALTGGSRADVDPWIEATVNDGDLAPISAATTAALTDPANADRRLLHVGTPRGRAGAALGRSLAAAAGASDPAAAAAAHEALLRELEGFNDAAQGSGIAKALELELDAEAGAGGKVARALSTWSTDPDGERDRALAGALLAEISGEAERALTDLDRARLVDPAHEGAARARAAHADPTMAARILAEHARALEPGTRGAVLLTEAAVRLTDNDAGDEAEPLLQKAASLDPKLPFAIHLGERSARARGDREGLIEWLHTRREGSDDAVEQAHDLVREALLVSDGEGTASAALLEQALRARPEDIGLRELFERLASEPPADRAEWRAERAAQTQGPDGARLALEAALDLERAGDMARASRLAAQAIAGGEKWLAPICAYRCAIAGHGAGDLIDAMLPRARETSDAIERLEIYERLADLDELGRNDAASGLLWRRSILEETPAHLPTLRRMASFLVGSGRDDELEPVALEIAKALEGPEAIAHAALCARLRLRITGWDETAEPVAVAYKNEPRGIWALRQAAAHARAQGKHSLAVEADRQLAERTDRPSELATICLRAAQSAAAGGDLAAARELLERATSVVPQYLFAQLERARVLDEAGEKALAAEAFEAAAAASAGAPEKVAHLHRAAVLWADHAKDGARARRALEEVAETDPSYADVFERLQAIYVAEGARGELAALLERRLDAVSDPKERVEMEVLRGRALADVGDSEAAKRALAAALDANPDHADALAAFADLCAREEDWSGAEQAWIRLARLVPDAARQSAIYLRLGGLYDEHLPNPERAELAYQEILKRSPADEPARERLVALYKRAGDVVRAIEQQTVLITAAESPEAKCKRTCELAEIYEATGDTKKAEATLNQARKTWPKDDVALGYLCRFFQRTGQAPAAQVLLDRAVADARRALGTGRFEPHLFHTVATVADLRGRPDAARIAHATVSALEGEATEVDGAGPTGGDARLDDVLAPELLTPAFRELLQRTGPLLDAAVPFDLAAVRATPLPPQQGELGEQIRAIAAGYGLSGVAVHVSSVLGQVCVPASAHPPTLVLGQALVAAPNEAARTFLVHRALKVIQSNSGAFSRTAPIDLWPLLAAYLKAFSPNWQPQGVDAARLTDAYGRITRATPARVDPQVGLLAADVIGTIGNRASTLGTAVNGWGNRTGLLALGDPNVALTGIAWANGQANMPPPSGKDRLTWIGRNTEARELIVFSVSDAYADARARLGLGRR